MLSTCNVQIIFMENEIDVTLRALDSVLAQLKVGHTVSLLLNGGHRPDLAVRLSSLHGVHFYESANNLGVAGGRNLLLNTEESKNSDVILFVDNDAIIPNDYIDIMMHALNANPDAGVIGAVTLRYKYLRSRMNQLGQPYTGFLGTDIWSITCRDLQKFFLNDPQHKYVDHFGTNKDWVGSYFLDKNTEDTILRNIGVSGRRKYFNVNRESPAFLKRVAENKDEKIEVSNIPGCCQGFRRSLVDEIGGLNNLFNNYGFEDADFALRAIKEGYTNYLIPSAYMLHGTDERHNNRTTSAGFASRQINESRARTVLEYLWMPDDFPFYSIRRIVQKHVARQLHERESKDYAKASEEAYYAFSGFQRGLTQLRKEFGTENVNKVISAGAEKHKLQLSGDLVSLPNTDIPLASLENIKEHKTKDANRNVVSLLTNSIKKQDRFIRLEKEKNGFDVTLFDSVGGQVSSKGDATNFEKLRKFKDLHKGERCFIVGNGPSLNKTDFRHLKNEITFGVNGIFYLTDSIGFEPTYYTVEDNHVVEDNIERIKSFPGKAKFFPEKYKSVIPEDKNTFFLPTDWGFYMKSHKFFETPRFSDDISREIFVGQTVTYLNMQLAYYMGFEEVYLIGLDFSYEIPKNDPVEGFSITSTADDPNHFHPEYFGKGKKWHFPKLHNCLKSYIHADEYYKANSRQIFNATKGGKLEAHERVEYDSLFDSPNYGQATPNDPLVFFTNLLFEDKAEENNYDLSVVCAVASDAIRLDLEKLFDHCKGKNIIKNVLAYKLGAENKYEKQLNGVKTTKSLNKKKEIAKIVKSNDVLVTDVDFLAETEITELVTSSNYVVISLASEAELSAESLEETRKSLLASLFFEVLSSGKVLWLKGNIAIVFDGKSSPKFMGKLSISSLNERHVIPCSIAFASHSRKHFDDNNVYVCSLPVDQLPRSEGSNFLNIVEESLEFKLIHDMILDGASLLVSRSGIYF